MNGLSMRLPHTACAPLSIHFCSKWHLFTSKSIKEWHFEHKGWSMEQNNCEENVELWNSTLYVFSIHYLSENRVKTEPLTYITTCKKTHLETTSDPTQHKLLNQKWWNKTKWNWNETETMPNQTFFMLCQCSVTTASIEELQKLGKFLVELA